MKRTMPIAARWADQWNYPDYTGDVEPFAERVPYFHSLVGEAGRRPADVEISVQFRFSGDLAATRDHIEACRELGAGHVLISFTPPIDPSLPPKVAHAIS